ncbi:hypothetical protein M885DRAFT_434992, partial [Pelagophyceae sp. CCMP2097]
MNREYTVEGALAKKGKTDDKKDDDGRRPDEPRPPSRGNQYTTPRRPPPGAVAAEAEDQWAQCDSCAKWRRLPATVDTDALPEKWYCRLNVWDPKRASCDYPDDDKVGTTASSPSSVDADAGESAAVAFAADDGDAALRRGDGAPISPARPAGKSAFQWVQCDRCEKWRRVPATIDTSQLPEQWFCEMNRWD